MFKKKENLEIIYENYLSLISSGEDNVINLTNLMETCYYLGRIDTLKGMMDKDVSDEVKLSIKRDFISLMKSMSDL